MDTVAAALVASPRGPPIGAADLRENDAGGWCWLPAPKNHTFQNDWFHGGLTGHEGVENFIGLKKTSLAGQWPGSG